MSKGFAYKIIQEMNEEQVKMGHSVVTAARAAKDGASLEMCTSLAKKSLYSSRFLFTPESLTFLEKGGRIGKAAALIGHIINISPILTVKDGEAGSVAKTRSQKKAMEKIVGILKEDIDAYGIKNLVVHYIGSKAPAEKWAEEAINPLVGFKARVV